MTHHVVVVSTGHGCIVVPPHQIVGPGDDVEIRNHTKDRIELSFPNPRLWSKEPDTTLDNGETGEGIVGNAPGGFYPYSVYCHRDGDYAEGHSHPGFIVR